MEKKLTAAERYKLVKRKRPRVTIPSTMVSARVTNDIYEKICQDALRAEDTISNVVRVIVEGYYKRKEK
jgi:hypothetical protein